GHLEGALAGVRLVADPEPPLALRGVDGGHMFRPGVGPAAMLGRVLHKARVIPEPEARQHPVRLASAKGGVEHVSEVVLCVAHWLSLLLVAGRSDAPRIASGRSTILAP